MADEINEYWMEIRKEKAIAFGRLVPDGFLVSQGSTAMLNGSPNEKRTRPIRDALIANGALKAGADPELLYFSRDFTFNSRSAAGGVIIDGNSNGREWKSSPTTPGAYFGANTHVVYPPLIKCTTSRSGAEMDSPNETETMRAIRLKQGLFREALLSRWNGVCALTGIGMEEVLRASHIKPFADSREAPEEQIDPENGLLLAVHIDILFDRGFMTFDDEGNMMLSKLVSDKVKEEFRLNRPLRIEGLSEKNRQYLNIHRSSYFKAV